MDLLDQANQNNNNQSDPSQGSSSDIPDLSLLMDPQTPQPVAQASDANTTEPPTAEPVSDLASTVSNQPEGDENTSSLKPAQEVPVEETLSTDVPEVVDAHQETPSESTPSEEVQPTAETEIPSVPVAESNPVQDTPVVPASGSDNLLETAVPARPNPPTPADGNPMVPSGITPPHNKRKLPKPLLIVLFLFFLISLPVIGIVINQRNQQIADNRSMAGTALCPSYAGSSSCYGRAPGYGCAKDSKCVLGGGICTCNYTAPVNTPVPTRAPIVPTWGPISTLAPTTPPSTCTSTKITECLNKSLASTSTEWYCSPTTGGGVCMQRPKPTGAQAYCDISKCPGGCVTNTTTGGSCKSYCDTTRCPNNCAVLSVNGGVCNGDPAAPTKPASTPLPTNVPGQPIPTKNPATTCSLSSDSTCTTRSFNSACTITGGGSGTCLASTVTGSTDQLKVCTCQAPGTTPISMGSTCLSVGAKTCIGGYMNTCTEYQATDYATGGIVKIKQYIQDPGPISCSISCPSSSTGGCAGKTIASGCGTLGQNYTCQDSSDRATSALESCACVPPRGVTPTAIPSNPGNPPPAGSCKTAGNTCTVGSCCSGLVCQGVSGSMKCEQPTKTPDAQCQAGGDSTAMCSGIIAFHCNNWFASECLDNPKNFGTWTEANTYVAGCGQIDQVCNKGSLQNKLCGDFQIIKDSCGTQPTSPPQPTNPPVAQCQNIKIYKGGQDISAAIRTNTAVIRRGDVLQIAAVGATASKARIRINTGSWTETSEKNSSGEYVMNYTVPATGDRTVKVEAEVNIANVWR